MRILSIIILTFGLMKPFFTVAEDGGIIISNVNGSPAIINSPDSHIIISYDVIANMHRDMYEFERKFTLYSDRVQGVINVFRMELHDVNMLRKCVQEYNAARDAIILASNSYVRAVGLAYGTGVQNSIGLLIGSVEDSSGLGVHSCIFRLNEVLGKAKWRKGKPVLDKSQIEEHLNCTLSKLAEYDHQYQATLNDMQGVLDQVRKAGFKNKEEK